MPGFVKGGSTSTPFGRNEFLRSTKILQTESYTLAASTVTARTIDGVSGQKILQPGTAMAKITSGPEVGKVGPFQSGAVSSEVQTLTLGAASAGTITITFDGETTGAIAFNASAATVQAALEAMSNVNAGSIVVTGGPLPALVTLTFSGPQYAGQNVPEITATPSGLTGGTVTIATTNQGGAAGGGATDGRQLAANIVGLDLTFLPWQLMERDVEISCVYECVAIQAWCKEYDAAGADIVLTNTTADAMRSTKGLDVLFK